MKKFSALSMIAGIIIGAILFGGVFAVAASVTASTSTWKFFVDGVPDSTIEAYSIEGSNYLKLRDVLRIADVGVWYDNDKKEVYIERDKVYDPNYNGPGSTPPTPPNVQSLYITYAGRVVTDFTEYVGAKIPLRVRIEPAGLQFAEEITWTSSDPGVFEVVTNNPEGTAATVVIIGSGLARSATLTVALGNARAECIIRVAANNP